MKKYGGLVKEQLIERIEKRRIPTVNTEKPYKPRRNDGINKNNSAIDDDPEYREILLTLLEKT